MNHFSWSSSLRLTSDSRTSSTLFSAIFLLHLKLLQTILMGLLQRISGALFGRVWYLIHLGVAVDRSPRSCISASPLFGNLAIPLFLDKINAGSPATKVMLHFSGIQHGLTTN